MGILIDKTIDSPYINFSEEGTIEIEGRSITEDVFSFWQPLLEWVSDYCSKPAETTKISFQLEYTNSSSNKYMNEILKRLDNCYSKGNRMQVEWIYEEDDESIYQLGLDLQSICSIPFNFMQIEAAKELARKVRIQNKKSGNEAVITHKYWDAIVRNGHSEDYIVLEEL